MTDSIDAISLLAEPNRRALYELVLASGEPVGRDDAAAALGISRELAAFHLDRLVDAGLLVTEYQRLNGRTGPGAGRPAKLYGRSSIALEASVPPRRYNDAAEVLASALESLPVDDARVARETVARVAHQRGVEVGSSARREIGGRAGRRRTISALGDVLRAVGYAPDVGDDGGICLRNCPYDALVASHRDLTCGMNLAWAEGIVEGLEAPGVTPVLAPEQGRCCVVFEPVKPDPAR
jgi:predicted ArsR family transcriptional regulator